MLSGVLTATDSARTGHENRRPPLPETLGDTTGASAGIVDGETHWQPDQSTGLGSGVMGHLSRRRRWCTRLHRITTGCPYGRPHCGNRYFRAPHWCRTRAVNPWRGLSDIERLVDWLQPPPPRSCRSKCRIERSSWGGGGLSFCVGASNDVGPSEISSISSEGPSRRQPRAALAASATWPWYGDPWPGRTSSVSSALRRSRLARA